MKIYTITYASYTKEDNYLYNEVTATTNRVEAINQYEAWKDNARSQAKGEDDEYNIIQKEASITDRYSKYEVARDVNNSEYYQAVIKLHVIVV